MIIKVYRKDSNGKIVSETIAGVEAYKAFNGNGEPFELHLIRGRIYQVICDVVGYVAEWG